MAQRTLLILALALLAGGVLLGGAVQVGSAVSDQFGERRAAAQQDEQDQQGTQRGPGDQPPFAGPGSRHHRPGGTFPHPQPSPTN